MLGTVIGGVGCSYPGHALAEISEDCHTQPQPSPGTKQMRSNSEGHVSSVMDSAAVVQFRHPSFAIFCLIVAKYT